MHTGVGATSGNGMDRSMGIEICDGLFQYSLHAGALPLPLPSTKKRPRILEADGDPLGRIGFRSRSEVVNRALVPKVSDQFDNGHLGIVATATHRAGDPGVTTLAVAVAIGGFLKQSVHELLVVHVAENTSA